MLQEATTSKQHSGAVIDETLLASIPGVPDNKIILCGVTGSTKMYTGVDPVTNHDALAPFSAFIALKGPEYASMQLDNFDTKTITITYTVETTNKNKVTDVITREFTSITQAPVILGKDYYGYTLSNLPVGRHWRAPFLCLESTNNTIYTNSFKERLKAALENAGLDTSHYNIAGLTGKVATYQRSTSSVQIGISYWDMIKQWMAEGRFTCFFDQKGVLTFVDDIKNVPSTNISLPTSLESHPNIDAQPTLKIAGLFDFKEVNQGTNKPFVTVMGMSPKNPTNIVFGSSGTNTAMNPHYCYSLDVDNNDIANATADAITRTINSNKQYLTGRCYSTPPNVGSTYKVSWQTPGEQGETRTATVVPINVVYCLTTFHHQDVLQNEALLKWTGQQPSQRLFDITFVNVDDGYLPCLDMQTQQSQNILMTHALTVNASGEIKGETVSKGNMIGVKLINENCSDSKPTIIFAHVLKPFSLKSAAPPAGTLVFIRFDNFGYAYIESAIQQIEVGTDITVSQAEDIVQAKITIATKQSIRMDAGDGKTTTTMQPNTIETSVGGGKTKQVMTDKTVETSTTNVSVTASGDHTTKSGQCRAETQAFSVNSATPAKINMLTAK